MSSLADELKKIMDDISHDPDDLSPEEFKLLKRLSVGGVRMLPDMPDHPDNMILNSLEEKGFALQRGTLDDDTILYRISATGKKAYKKAAGIPLGGEDKQ